MIYPKKAAKATSFLAAAPIPLVQRVMWPVPRKSRTSCLKKISASTDLSWPPGSTGTHAGLVAGIYGCNMNIPIVGIDVSRDPENQDPLVYDLVRKRLNGWVLNRISQERRW